MAPSVRRLAPEIMVRGLRESGTALCKEIAVQAWKTCNDMRKKSEVPRARSAGYQFFTADLIAGGNAGVFVSRELATTQRLWVQGRSKTISEAKSLKHLRAKHLIYMVEPSGIEPLTSCMPCKRSPS